MKLYLIRHAKAVSSSGELDVDRILASKGLEQSEALSVYLCGKLENTTVWCSEANRTRETFKIIAENSHFTDVLYRLDFYLCDKETMLEQLWKNSNEKDVLIVGHNFGISDLLNYFTDESISMRTGEYFCIDFGELSLKESSKSTGRIVDGFRME
ncbi:MAG: histidine phosphatase family protein [Fluviicola sp.]|nr:histidine phosphatase family protein [Fluviicola sp.]